jgi:hypothetical protein
LKKAVGWHPLDTQKLNIAVAAGFDTVGRTPTYSTSSVGRVAGGFPAYRDHADHL